MCPKSPSVRGFVASLPLRLLFESILHKHNALDPVSSNQFICRMAAMTKPGKCIVFYVFKQYANR